MPVLFFHAIILYCLVFIVIRLMGKRQISDLQPFDLVFTLLIADLASNPIGDTSVPLLYGVIPIIALFLVQQLVSYISLKSEGARHILAGKPQIIIAKGVLQEDVMRNARYSINDLMEQLRSKDVFDITQVAYAIIETDGTLSVLLDGAHQQITMQALHLFSHAQAPCELIVLDGRLHTENLSRFEVDEAWLLKELEEMGFVDVSTLFIVSLSPEGALFAQTKQKHGAIVRKRQTTARAV